MTTAYRMPDHSMGPRWPKGKSGSCGPRASRRTLDRRLDGGRAARGADSRALVQNEPTARGIAGGGAISRGHHRRTECCDEDDSRHCCLVRRDAPPMRAARSLKNRLREQAMILIVDDDSDVRRLMGEVLRQAGYSVVAASDGNMASAILACNEIDLLDNRF